MRVTSQQIIRLLGAQGLRRMLQSHGLLSAGRIHGLDDEDGEDGEDGYYLTRRQRRQRDPNRFPKVPSDAGLSLMNTGTYGSADAWADRRRRRKEHLNQRLMWRRLGTEGRGTQRRANRLIAQVRKAVH